MNRSELPLKGPVLPVNRDTLMADTAADFATQRNRMIDVQIARRGVRDRRLLDAMRQVPREQFVGSGYDEFA